MRLGKLGNITDKIIDKVLDTVLDEGSELIENVLEAVRNSDIIDEIIDNECISVIGGGDTIAAVRNYSNELIG